jgi:hypothetical protein
MRGTSSSFISRRRTFHYLTSSFRRSSVFPGQLSTVVVCTTDYDAG